MGSRLAYGALKPRIIDAIQAGGGNAEIARSLGCSRCYVADVRANLGLPPLAAGRGALAESIVLFVQAGEDDSAVARRLGVHRETVSRCRQARGLASPIETLHARRVEQVKNLHAQGCSDREISRRLRAGVATVTRMRSGLGLPALHSFNGASSRELGRAARWSNARG